MIKKLLTFVLLYIVFMYFHKKLLLFFSYYLNSQKYVVDAFSRQNAQGKKNAHNQTLQNSDSL